MPVFVFYDFRIIRYHKRGIKQRGASLQSVILVCVQSFVDNSRLVFPLLCKGTYILNGVTISTHTILVSRLFTPSDNLRYTPLILFH